MIDYLTRVVVPVVPLAMMPLVPLVPSHIADYGSGGWLMLRLVWGLACG
jgi:hypothetical protein